MAIAALNRAKELCHLPDLTADSAAEWLETFQRKNWKRLKKCSLEQKMSMAQTAHSQFEQAYQLVVAINGPLAARNEAWDVARELLREGVDQRHPQSRFNRCGCA